ncbi:degenerin mec-10-like [Saccoglossus kowalevskii]
METGVSDIENGDSRTKQDKRSFEELSIESESGEKCDGPITKTQEKIVEILEQFASSTTAHGINRVSSTERPFRKVMWCMIVLVAFSTFTIHASALIIKYLDFDVTYKLKVMKESTVEFPSVTMCNMNKMRKSAIINTKYHDIAKFDDYLQIIYKGPCYENDIPCHDEKDYCIKPYMLCNGVRDCPNSEDEKNCRECTNSEFECADGVCIPLDRTCDHKFDCLDDSDEVGCPIVNCTADEWRCNSLDCIPVTSYCNGIRDCYDSSDEPAGIDCMDPLFCPGEYKCEADALANTLPKCIPLNHKCDKFIDCSGGDDEENCDYEAFHDVDVFTDSKWYEQFLDLTNDRELVNNFKQIYYANVSTDMIPNVEPLSTRHAVLATTSNPALDIRDILSVSADEISIYGHQKDDMILTCQYQKHKCKMGDITEFQDDKYGNCFTFNPSTVERQLYNASKTGRRYGLTLILFVEQSEYLALFSEEVGFVLSIHNPHIQSFPEDDSVSIITGYGTSIGISMSETKKLEQPWDNCTRDSRTPYDHYSYSLLACEIECLQMVLRDKCGCVDVLSISGYTKCSILNKTQGKENIALVNVYFDSLHIETVSQEEAYGIIDLFADIGGALGLWIGISAVTLFEVIELVINIFSISFTCHRKVGQLL